MNAPEAVGIVPASNGLAPGRPLRQSRDARGVVFEPLDAAALAAQRNVHVVLSVPGTRIETIDVPAGAAWRFEFPPGVAHAFENTGRETQVLVAFATQPHDPANPDTFRDTLLGDVVGPTRCEDDL